MATPPLIAHIDGGSRGNPGPAATGVVLVDSQTGQPVHEAGYYIGQTTNNVAEYNGLIRALEVALAAGTQQLRIQSDSELMVRQITGEYRVKSEDLRPLFEKAQMLLIRLDSWHIVHVKREQNKRADELVNLALDAKRDVVLRSVDGSKVTGAPGGADAATPRPRDTGPGATPSDCWVTVRLTRDPGPVCPARCPADEPFELGPDTPAGLCVYAAKAALDALLDEKSVRAGAVILCPRCKTPVRLTPVE